MDKLYTNKEYLQILEDIEKKYVTYYAWGAFGAPATDKNKTRYKVPNAPSNAFLFDCSGFAYKAIPWGWDGNKNRVYGGATYKAIPELETANILNICSDVSTDFSKIEPGEVLYMPGHVGIYVGDGKAIECTSKWENCVLYSEVSNAGIATGLNHRRKWSKHGKLPFITYEESKASYIEYKIRPGDTLTKIALKYNVTVWALAKANGIANINFIRAGKILKIPR